MTSKVLGAEFFDRGRKDFPFRIPDFDSGIIVEIFPKPLRKRIIQNEGQMMIV